MKRPPEHDTSQQQRAWLCIASAFPPINRSGTHRTLGFVRHLSRWGWDATVVCARPNSPIVARDAESSSSDSLDHSLLDRIPPGTTVHRVAAPHPIQSIKHWLDWLRWNSGQRHRTAQAERNESTERQRTCDGASADPAHLTPLIYPDPDTTSNDSRGLIDWMTRLLMMPDSHSAWIIGATLKALKASQRRRPQVIYSTSPCMSAHVSAMLVSYLARVPWVADFRDPWRGNPFRTLPYATLDRFDQWLEQRVLRRASGIICNTETSTRALRDRMPWVSSKCMTVMNGFDSDLYDGVTPARTRDSDTFVFAHAGQFYGRRRPEPWFHAFRRLLDEQSSPRKIKLLLIGKTTCDGTPLHTIARDAGVADHVDFSGEVSHERALSLLAGSDALLLAGASGPGAELQIPNKLFEYLALRKPIVAGIDHRNPARRVLKSAAARAAFCTLINEVSITEAMKQTMEPETSGRHFQHAHLYDRKERARELLHLFQAVCTRQKPLRPVKHRAIGRDRLLQTKPDVFNDAVGPAYRK